MDGERTLANFGRGDRNLRALSPNPNLPKASNLNKHIMTSKRRRITADDLLRLQDQKGNLPKTIKSFMISDRVDGHAWNSRIRKTYRACTNQGLGTGRDYVRDRKETMMLTALHLPAIGVSMSGACIDELIERLFVSPIFGSYQ